MNIKVICVGKLKEKFIREAQDEYLKRLSKYVKLEVIELADEKIKDGASSKEEEIVKDKECKKILKEIEKTPKAYVYAMDLSGKMYTSEELAENINNIFDRNASTIVFVIGGSLGLTKEVLDRCNEKLSFSKLTFPHQLFRIFLLEQIFRSFKINNNETYHK